MAGSDRLRLFCALRLPDDTVDRLVRWQSDELQATSRFGGRLVGPQHLHVTLAFLGSRPAADLPAIVAALESAAASARSMGFGGMGLGGMGLGGMGLGGIGPGDIAPRDIRLRVRAYRETRSVGMLTFDDEDERATVLAERVGAELEAAGVYRREARPWLPHVTVLRFRERPRLRPPLPDLGEVSPSDAAAYSSVLRSGGARYEILETVTLLTTSYGLGG